MSTLEQRDPHAWQKAIEIRNRLRKDLGKYLNGAHYIDIVVRYGGKDVRIEFDWVKELLR